MYNAALNAYRKNAVTTVEDPQKIVKLLFEEAIKELSLTKNFFDEPLKRGKHLGRAIALVGELQAGVNLEKGGEAAEFLYGLYGAIIRELSQLNGNYKQAEEVIERSIRYLSELKRIWVEQVLNLPSQEKTKPSQASERLAVNAG
ncbi:flagellar protein FliS [Thermodesulfatator indicus DSM 15286]|uniref:Flagellar protein FliS n=1 Tax=Thermodesulfatator indicus (strain DSM 15286 / JCM 11887 / CIR29812) TaxID=667014 RepID=F8AAQ8_THEID|nr:flagellar export chaperone FliS [Thermodesulfatator indicus]AEH44335.1 flagellar protein FliS [Thermodesulfatator indicus DSM 15286]